MMGFRSSVQTMEGLERWDDGAGLRGKRGVSATSQLLKVVFWSQGKKIGKRGRAGEGRSTRGGDGGSNVQTKRKIRMSHKVASAGLGCNADRPKVVKS